MKTRAPGLLAPLALAAAFFARGASAAAPHIGYAYPAGGCRGTVLEVRVGGKDVYGATEALVSGAGVTAEVIDSAPPAEPVKNQNRQSVIAEVVKLKITIAPDAAPGARHIGLATPGGLSNKLLFQVGQLPELGEAEPPDKPEKPTPLAQLPATVNGQIMPGDVDRFEFQARKGQRLVAHAAARALVPYIADAVPGWFQAVLILADGAGREVAYADDYRFSPDPVLFCEIPADGAYVLSIRDSIYRGREDFVYRIAVGELPYITSIFPLGAAAGETPVPVQLTGWNLPADSAAVAANVAAPAVQWVTVTNQGLVAPPVPFAVGSLPEAIEDEAATAGAGEGQGLRPPVVVNGRVGVAGEKDVFRFDGRKGDAVRLEVQARRLGSPLDSQLVLADAAGKTLAANDDTKDSAEGFLTHAADSALTATLPEDGTYRVTLYDTQGKGGREYSYRLKVGPPLPDFALRVLPAAVPVPQNGSAALTVRAIRRDGFRGEIRIALDPPLEGLALAGGVIPDGAERAGMTLSAAEDAAPGTFSVRLVGTAVIGGGTVARTAVPAEDMMQAFIYRHLVPSGDEQIRVTVPPAPVRAFVEVPVTGSLMLPRGKESGLQVKTFRRPGYEGKIQLQLVDPPPGIQLRNGIIAAGCNSARLTLRTESKVAAGLRGHLILRGTLLLDEGRAGVAPTNSAAAMEAAEAMSMTNRPAAPVTQQVGVASAPAKRPEQKRVSLTLPAVPFCVMEPPLAESRGSERRKPGRGNSLRR